MPGKTKDVVHKLHRQMKLLQEEVLMYQHLLEGMRQDLSYIDLLKLILKDVTKGFGYDRAGIFLVTPDGKLLERAIGVDAKGKFEIGPQKDAQNPLSPKKGFSIFSDIVHGYKEFFFTNNLLERMPQAQVELGVACNANVPMQIGKGKIIGVLAVDNLFTRRKLAKPDIISLVNFASQAGLAIESYRLHEKITTLTVTDSLTGIYNRRHFEHLLLSELKRSERYARPCGLIYMDVDHFKAVNDRWGHGAGDEALKQVANAFRTGIRNIDITARLGGDEFAVILPETNKQGTGLAADRLVRRIAELNLATLKKKITISAGVACFPDSAKDADSLRLAADKSLYEAKNAGRNRVGPYLTA
jgi:diguanylate cyclase (GGDEF)-like protein